MSFVSIPLVVLILVVVGITVLAVKAGAVALRLTGLDDDRAEFQALSAVTGTGFTTRESELVMADPRRRRVVQALMILGNVVLVTLISLLVGSFSTFESAFDVPVTVLILVAGAYALYRFYVGRSLSRRFSDWVAKKVEAHLTLRERPVHEVLVLAEGYGVAEVRIGEDAVCAGKSLQNARLRERGLLVLAIRRDGEVLPAPRGGDRIEPGDRLVCYGDLERLHKVALASLGAEEPQAEDAAQGKPADAAPDRAPVGDGEAPAPGQGEASAGSPKDP